MYACRVVLPNFNHSPLKAAWDPHPTYSYKCFNTSIFIAIVGIINTLTDFLCTILPAFIVFKLQMPLRKRLGISSLFLVGILVNIASVLRIYYLYYENETSDSWNSLPSSVCSNLELGLGLVGLHPCPPFFLFHQCKRFWQTQLCVNLPVIRPLITHYKNTSIDYVGYLRSRTGGSKYDPNAYLHSQCSEDFFSVGDDSKPAAVYLSRISAGSGHGPSVYPRSIKANVTTDKVGSLQRVDSIWFCCRTGSKKKKKRGVGFVWCDSIATGKGSACLLCRGMNT